MFVFKVRNVHEALHKVMSSLVYDKVGVERASRNGPVLYFPEPVTTQYLRPLERVVFWRERDANPFFHFYESLWMLGGRNDVASLTRYVPRMKDFSDDGAVFHGAYGYRWRTWFGCDQLKIIGDRLKENFDDRRQVLAMWDGHEDLDRQAGRKDLPCNTHAYFSISPSGYLNMTVCNRSNDIVLGAFGANAVHFSYLQEYMANRVGVPVGYYWQVSNNFHCYQQDLTKMEALLGSPNKVNPYEFDMMKHYPLMSVPPDEWDAQLVDFLNLGRALPGMDPFFRKVADPMLRAHNIFKADKDIGRFGAAQLVLNNQCADKVWAANAVQWLERRRLKQQAAMDDGVQHGE